MICFSIRIPGKRELIFPLTGDRILVGRGEHCDVVLHDETCSLEQFSLSQDKKQYSLTPIDPDIRLNGKTLTSTITLSCGDLIETGEAKILYIEEGGDFRPNEIDASQTISLQEVGKDGNLLPRETSSYALQYTKGDKKRVLRLTDQALTIGRHHSCGLVLPDPSVSSCHARIECVDEEYRITDLDSRNGIRLNGQKVKDGVLYPGTRIRIGKAVMSFKEIVPGPPPTSFVDPQASDDLADADDLPADIPGLQQPGSSVIYEENWDEAAQKLKSDPEIDPFSPTSAYTAVAAADSSNSARGIRVNLPPKKKPKLQLEWSNLYLVLILLLSLVVLGGVYLYTKDKDHGALPPRPHTPLPPTQSGKPAEKPKEAPKAAPAQVLPVTETIQTDNMHEMVDKTPVLPQDASSSAAAPVAVDASPDADNTVNEK